MRLQMSKSEVALRTQFDFSKGVRGKYLDRFNNGHTVTLLEGELDEGDPLTPQDSDSQLVEMAGKHLLISRLVAAGFEVAEPLRDNGIDLIVYRDGKDFLARPVQLKAFSHESFSLDEKYKKFPHLLIAYVWNAQTPERSDVYALTFDDAMQVMDKKGYSKTDSWTKGGRYFVRDAGVKLKEILKPYRMTREKWREKLQTV
jgi:hypothetical protein